MKKYFTAMVSAFVIVGLVSTAGTANAANAATCGSGFEQVTTNRLHNASGVGPGQQKLYVKKVSAGWQWCLITDRIGAAEGVPGYTFAGLQRINSASFDAQDSGNYSYFAGPIFLTTGKKAISYRSDMRFNGATYVQAGNYSN